MDEDGKTWRLKVPLGLGVGIPLTRGSFHGALIGGVVGCLFAVAVLVLVDPVVREAGDLPAGFGGSQWRLGVGWASCVAFMVVGYLLGFRLDQAERGRGEDPDGTRATMSMIIALHRVDSQTLVGLLAETIPIITFLYESDRPPADSVDLDKAWHGIHFLLNGDPWGGVEPLNYLVAGGEAIGTEDVGYGPARAVTPAEVLVFHAALEEIPPEELRSRFDPARMMQEEIYPTIWDRDPAEDDTLGYLVEYYEVLRGFVAATAEAGQGLVIACT